MFSTLKAAWARLAGGQAANEAEAPAVEYNGFRIRPNPYRTGGQYQTAGTIEKDGPDGVRQHRFVRADSDMQLDGYRALVGGEGRQRVRSQESQGHRLERAADARVVGELHAADQLAHKALDRLDRFMAALARLKGKVTYQPIGFELLPPKFTLSQLQRLYEIVLDRPLDKRNFRKKILSMGVLVETDEVQQDVAHRAARLYRFDEAKYKRLVKKGFNFEI